MEIYIKQFYALVVVYIPQILLALITLFIGLRVIKFATRIFRASLKKQKLDDTVKDFLAGMVNFALKAALVISVASILGVKTTSFVAILGAAGLAVGLALQGSLSNFAGGVLILMFKPFKVGDLIETQGHFGEVQKILIFNTVITTLEGKAVILPNASITNGVITNHTENGKIRVEVVAGIAYDADLRQAKQVLEEMLKKEPLVMAEPAPSVSVLALADSSVNLTIRPWCKPEDYWTVFFSVTENAKLVLDQHNIEIPFPQQDVYIKQHAQG